MDQPSLEFLRRAIAIQCRHREAFASHDVEPLVPTEAPGLFANRFVASKQRVWTLYNANGRSYAGPVLCVPHVAGARDRDAWNDRQLTPAACDGRARVSLALEPKGVGCLVQDLLDHP